MEFRRKGRGRFVSGNFTIVRPSGRKLSREKLDLSAPGHDYNVRTDGDKVWLLDGEREVGFAEGFGGSFDVLVGARNLVLEQPRPGVNHSVFREGGAITAQSRASGFPLKLVELIGADDLEQEARAFLVALSLLGWRESDRQMIGGGPASGAAE